MNHSSSCQHSSQPSKRWKLAGTQTYTMQWCCDWPDSEIYVLKENCPTKLLFITSLINNHQDGCDSQNPLYCWPPSSVLHGNTLRASKTQKWNDETGEIHFSHPSICAPLINVSVREIEWHHLSVFIRLGWSLSQWPLRVHTHLRQVSKW